MNSQALPPGDSEDRGSYVLTVIWIQYSISALVIALRFWARLEVTRNIWWDDWSILVPFVRNVSEFLHQGMW